ncbi:MAG: SUMF1/EgtB/PvdO family nonheme iron enzyme [Deltaproteobacteria bacterium]|nr:SUMF1/EgtB/PvdO family nonheme iron enzyme [Deltaproteobacteria bacterium]
MSTSLTPRAGRKSRVARVAAIVAGAVALPGFAAASLTSSASPELTIARVVVTPPAPVTVNKTPRPCPSNMAHVGTSCVDKYEGSLVEIQANGTETAFSPYQAPNGHHVRAVSRPGVVPQAHISMVEAKRACAASGKRLCKAAEWKKACKGPENTRFPYGEKRVANACVDTNRSSPMNKLFGGVRTAASMNDPRANQMANTVEKTGATATCTNGYGVNDMVGNVHEWTDDGSFRGGYYLDTKLNGDGCDYRTTAHARDYYDYSTGFRCCADEGFAGGE